MYVKEGMVTGLPTPVIT